jgi:superfamily II DNA or RNA helicase
MSSNGYIYIRSHESYHKYNVYKLGKTKNIVERDSQYATNEIVRGKFIFVIELHNYNDIFVEKILQNYFKSYNRKFDGGIEFYNIKILDEILDFLIKTKIQFTILSQDEIDNLCRIKRLKTIKFNFKSFRNRKQDEYLDDIIYQFGINNKCFIKAPTGFGKTHVYYKLIKQLNLKKILILTPRRNLNIQITDNKYSFYLNNYKYHHFSHLTHHNKKQLFENEIISDSDFIITSCYQSKNLLLELIIKTSIYFDLIIYDEAHFIENWIDDDFIKNDITRYRLFGSATPTDIIELNSNTFGSIVEKVKVHQLMNNKILCDIQTLIKKLDDKKKEYHNLKNMIIDIMTKYNKRKGIIYVNSCENANKLYKLIKKSINVYIYTSKIENEEKQLELFENNNNPSIIIAVSKISYGYDNDQIDFICLGDPRQSDIDIRQIIGRGLRWNQKTYPNKILHLLIPLYKDEFNEFSSNQSLKNYLNYIIGECDKDIIFTNHNKIIISDGKIKNVNNIYEGDDIPTDILLDYCTTGYNKFTDFMRFLRRNRVEDEISYNELRSSQEWMQPIKNLKKKYPKFCFQEITNNKNKYYLTKKEAEKAFDTAKDKLILEIGKDKCYELTQTQLIKKINKLDNKIPLIDFDLYY